jgi:hypothetical protein
MTDMNDSPARTPSTYTENSRATATAFSQLTSVLGGFSITILVLVLGSSPLGSHKTARDWTVGLLLLAAVTYIASSAFLANSMNADTFMTLNKIREKKGKPQRDVVSTQQGTFTLGIRLFHIGNFFLAAAIFITVYQTSLRLGIIASIAIIVIVVIVGIINALI